MVKGTGTKVDVDEPQKAGESKKKAFCSSNDTNKF